MAGVNAHAIQGLQGPSATAGRPGHRGVAEAARRQAGAVICQYVSSYHQYRYLTIARDMSVTTI